MTNLRKGYADTPNGQIHFRQLKAVDATPRVLFHQTVSSGMMFERLMTLIADDFHTIAPDNPGFGASLLGLPACSLFNIFLTHSTPR